MPRKSLSKLDAPTKILNNEKKLDDDDFIVSKTDIKGKIIYCNEVFIKMAGYSISELIGANHNLIRHPDMPRIAFKGLWDDIQSKGFWTGIVKNLRKDGG
ncbi:MAG: PAS domain-containing protein, partial [Sulfurimonas sp.]|nr:PAS domain-containing protein [Sulfurimonas sp.]